MKQQINMWHLTNFPRYIYDGFRQTCNAFLIEFMFETGHLRIPGRFQYFNSGTLENPLFVWEMHEVFMVSHALHTFHIILQIMNDYLFDICAFSKLFRIFPTNDVALQIITFNLNFSKTTSDQTMRTVYQFFILWNAFIASIFRIDTKSFTHQKMYLCGLVAIAELVL